MIRIRYTRGNGWKLPLSRTELTDALHAICTAAGHPDASLELNLVDDAEVAELNASFLGCHGPTNILSFPSGEADGQPQGTGPGLQLGWLALSLDTLHREALLYGQDVTEHAMRLLAHGTLHLAGHDHGETMFGLQEKAAESALLTLSAA